MKTWNVGIVILILITMFTLYSCPTMQPLHRAINESNKYQQNTTHIYWHIAAFQPSIAQIIEQQASNIIMSGLYRDTAVIHCYITGIDTLILEAKHQLARYGKKFLVDAIGVNNTEFERFTLHHMAATVLDSHKVLYIHTKGATKPDNQEVRAWRMYMEYFLMSQYRECLVLLDTHDTVGVELQDEPVMHYSGNFWWARGDYIKRLKMPIGSNYNDHEFWLLSQSNNYTPIAYCLSDTPLNLYTNRYVPELYVDSV